MSEPTLREYFQSCNVCKRQIAYGAQYYSCSVSTCNRPRFTFHFCSLDCFSAHAPDHRDAWAEPNRAPSREEQQRALQAQAEAAAASEARRQARIIGESAQLADLAAAPKEVLVVVSKLKGYIKTRGEMNTEGAVSEHLSEVLRTLCDEAIVRARKAGRKTVMVRDFDE